MSNSHISLAGGILIKTYPFWIKAGGDCQRNHLVLQNGLLILFLEDSVRTSGPLIHAEFMIPEELIFT